MLGEVADGLGPILGGRGLGQQLLDPVRNQQGWRRFWGVCVWVIATCHRGEVYLFPRVLAVGFGGVFRGRSEPNQAEMDVAETIVSVH